MSAAEKMIAVNPNFAWGHHELGLILHYVGRSEEVFQHFERAMALDPYCPDIWLHCQAQTAYQLGPLSRGRRAPETAHSAQPRPDASRALLAASYG